MKQKINLTLVLVLLLSTISLSGRAWAAKIPNTKINPADFSTDITNKYFMLKPGTTFDYKSKTADGTETNKMIVTNLVREVMGVKTLVVWDRVWLDGNLIEETYDWYAQSKTGDVWYFGEESREYENGKVSSTHGSWEGGINGALPGVIMEANPKVGDSYYQEYYKGEAEDQTDVLALNQTITVPYGTFSGCLKTSDYTNLAIQKKETKYYCPGAGVTTQTITDASGEKDELVSKQINADFVQLSSLNGDSDSTSGVDNQSSFVLAVATGLLGVLAGIGLERFVVSKPKKAPEAKTSKNKSS